ncbi:hypothetical protein [Endothiovibrio diazotrophicus]
MDKLSHAEWKLKALLALIAGLAEERTDRLALSPDELTGLHLILAEVVGEIEAARQALQRPFPND